jgi:hypothetical protein
MKNLRIFGSPIHDTALVVIVTSSITSVIFSFFSEIGRTESNISILTGLLIGAAYWYTQYKNPNF